VNGLDLPPNDLAAAHAMPRVERAARQAAEAQLAERDAALAHQVGEVAALRLEIERLKLLLAKARHAQFGRSSEGPPGIPCTGGRLNLSPPGPW
jgi:hypothetical protein